MLKTYIKLAVRSLLKNKVFSFINVFGLAIGLTCCLLISLYIYNELSYDAHQKYADRLYAIGTASTIDGKTKFGATTPAPMVKMMQQEFPEIESTVRIMRAFQDDKTLLQYKPSTGDLRSFYETNGFYADSTFFQLFTYNFKEGNPATALNNPNSVVISEEIAKKIFGNESALNKTVHINSNTNDEFDFTVTGVFVPAKTPTHINGEFFMSMQGGAVGQWERRQTNLLNNNLFYSYLLLKPGTNIKQLEDKFVAFIDKHAGADLKAQGRSRKQFLTAVKDIHLYSKATENNITTSGSIKYLYILISIAIVTLLIACVNFMNLSTARSAKRAVEIGVRKVLGAEKRSLVRQFLWEAILLSIVSFIISLAFAFILLPLFEQVSGKDYTFSAQQLILISASFFIISLIAGIIAGVYPAFYLSAFKPVKVLKGRFSNSLGAISFRKVLVVFQFVISVALIVASTTIGNQMKYLRTKDLGFEKDQQIIIPLRTTVSKEIYPALKDAITSNANISAAGASAFYPGIANVSDWLLYKQGNPSADTKVVYMNFIDNSYLQTLGVRLVAGRLFSKEFPGDTANRIVLNETAVKQFGFKSAEDAIGKNIAADRGSEVLFPIVGVVKDFHFKGLHDQIESYGFLLNSQPYYNYVVAHAKATDMQSTLASIGAAWNKLNPNEPFEYSFLDQDFQKNYEAEERLASIIKYFTIVAIFISCLGLFGLTTFTVEQRTKEIGIRKVLGASSTGIVGLLSKDFLKLVVISFFIASPIAWYFINEWLNGFAYRTPFTVWILIIGWSMALLIAFLTISIQAVKVAVSNPVKSIRTE